MRHPKREIKDRNKVEELLKSCTTMQLGLWDGVKPYAVTVNFGYADNAVYFHSAMEGLKMDCVRANGLVAFTTVVESELIRAEDGCGYTTHYTSVSGFGKATLLEAPEDKAAALDVILAQHQGPTGGYPDKVLQKTAVVRIDLDELVGKVNPAYPGDPQI
ncbi:pyridoxamine 5'-phosphate oxidase family protein [Maridesulfovibrio sp.]|uniref:pyridoxamine 5'-phosphate oxidase family protein n=1 Tax=Maridesulfovibrio sp. TaxID=2795000 RepID=UPI002A18D6CE|nr:pyridoxamine 5'-phosphate oxidase family protein [Maridesulfovibrio sp.]